MQKFIIPSTSPTFVSRVTRTTISEGGTIWANCGLVSICPSRGRRSMTVAHASRRLPRMRTMMPSMTDCLDVGELPRELGPLPLPAEQAVDDGEGDGRVDLQDRGPLQRVHVDDGDGGGVGDGADELLVGELVHRRHVHVREAAQLRGQRRGGLAREGFVHDGDGADLVLGELVGSLEVIDLDLALVHLRDELLGGHLAGRDRGEKLVYLVLGEDFRHPACPTSAPRTAGTSRSSPSRSS